MTCSWEEYKENVTKADKTKKSCGISCNKLPNYILTRQWNCDKVKKREAKKKEEFSTLTTA
jgi:hypothetical protein